MTSEKENKIKAVFDSTMNALTTEWNQWKNKQTSDFKISREINDTFSSRIKELNQQGITKEEITAYISTKDAQEADKSGKLLEHKEVGHLLLEVINRNTPELHKTILISNWKLTNSKPQDILKNNLIKVKESGIIQLSGLNFQTTLEASIEYLPKEQQNSHLAKIANIWIEANLDPDEAKAKIKDYYVSIHFKNQENEPQTLKNDLANIDYLTNNNYENGMFFTKSEIYQAIQQQQTKQENALIAGMQEIEKAVKLKKLLNGRLDDKISFTEEEVEKLGKELENTLAPLKNSIQQFQKKDTDFSKTCRNFVIQELKKQKCSLSLRDHWRNFKQKHQKNKSFSATNTFNFKDLREKAQNHRMGK